MLSSLALMCLIASASAQTNQLPSLLQQAVSGTESSSASYAYDFEYSTAAQAFSAHFSPRSQPRLRLVSPAREALNGDMRTDYDYFAEHMEGVSWCAAANMSRITNARLIREDETTATYSFQPTRESVTGEQTRRIVNHLRGEFTVTKTAPDITRIHIFAPQPFSPAPLARVEVYVLTTTCALAPNGRRYASESVHQSRGSAFGRAFDTRTVRRTRNLALAG